MGGIGIIDGKREPFNSLEFWTIVAWESEKDSLEKWPPTMIQDIF